MCGFVGIFANSGRKPDIPELGRMLDAIVHRGPDDSGSYSCDWVGFGFRRLSIQDLSLAGHQPMQSDDQKFMVVFNGEIFNFVELRSELEKLDHQFRSTSDTEVLLHAYMEWGKDCVSHFNGMWAFLIHDKHRNIVFGSRDRFGIKPLFRFKARNQWVFASEIKSIRQHGDFRFVPNYDVVAKFLYEGQLDAQVESFYAGIDSVAPGHCFEIDANGRYQQWKFWDLKTEAADLEIGSDTAEEYASLFEDAVRLRLRSDVPVGVFLSGGMDSSAILCAIARLQKSAGNHGASALNALGYMDAQYNESEYVDATVAWTGANFKRLTESPQRLWELAPQMLSAQDEPVHSFTPVIGFALSNMAAKEGVKVILNGQGADETAAGYPSYFMNLWQSMATSGQLLSLWRQLGEYTEGYGGNRMALMFSVVRIMAQKQFSRFEFYRRASRQRASANTMMKGWFSKDFAFPIDCEPGPFRTLVLSEQLERSVRVAPLPIYLRVEDRNSMAHSLEFRLPYLDYRLVKYLFALPPLEKLNGKWNKYIMRCAMVGRIPESIHKRVDKMGFPTQFSNWCRHELRENVRDIIESTSLRSQGWLNVDNVKQEFEKHCRGEKDISTDIFRVVQLFWWMEHNRA